jgi:ADP-ribosylglycohydrolase
LVFFKTRSLTKDFVLRSPEKSNYRGCLIGQCLGDALGRPAEGYGSEECTKYIIKIVSRWLEDEKLMEEQFEGQYTDDSQLARELMQSFVECEKFDPENYARRIGDIFAENRIVGRGLATNKAAINIIKGIPWKESGCPPPEAGNGTAMRAAPIGLFFYNDNDKLTEAAHIQGFITHQDPRCSAGSAAIAGAVAYVLQHDHIDIPDFLDYVSTMATVYDESFGQLISGLNDWVNLEPDEAVELIAPAGTDPGYDRGWPGISPFVIGSVLWSLYSFLKFPDDYWEAVITAIEVGGDVDTTAAMTGAISGAFLGLEAIPAKLAARVNDRGTWDLPELIRLADECYTIAHG